MKKYRLKKNVKMVLYKAGIVLVCLLLLLNVSDLSRLEDFCGGFQYQLSGGIVKSN